MVGTGGQGILLLARALAEIAVRRGCPVISSETHGMAMRGGTVTANLKIGDFASPLIPAGSADILIGLECRCIHTERPAIVPATARDHFYFAGTTGKLATL